MGRGRPMAYGASRVCRKEPMEKVAVLAADHLVKHGSQLGRPSIQAAAPTPHLLRLLPPRPSPRHATSHSPRKCRGFLFFLVKTKKPKIRDTGVISPIRLKVVSIWVSQLSPFLKCCYIKSLQQQNRQSKNPSGNAKWDCQVGPEKEAK